ncbi:lipase member H-like [Trichogramma pretiosum]|uniref:lipase member H-like n=1 Tax=Trichogramma pretiosum TaxID=7493 RepID=UPI0006C95A2E|nr:lipase member H-like [Trichogramma pretiosum]
MHTCKCAFWSCVFVTFVALSVNTSDSFSVRSILASIFYDSKKVANGLKDLRFRHYTGFPLQELGDRSFSLDQTSDVLGSIDQQKPFVLYIHGYEEHPSNESVQTIVTAYLQRASDNIVVLDWSAVAFGNYVGVALSTEDVSKYTAEALGKLVSAGLNVNTLHVIGHSLGGQIAGFLGRYLDFVIPRVTGLDPANPMFYQFGAEHINEKSGRQVDVVHTDGGVYGALPSTGSVDFFANGGYRPQPGCPTFGGFKTSKEFCSHWRSWRFYAESVNRNTSFPALECESYSKFIVGSCKGNRVVHFGYSLPPNVTGTFYFQTNADVYYGRGLNGI